MQIAELYAFLGTQALIIAMSVLRISVAFMILPMFSSQVIPSMVRNALYLSLALVSILVQAPGSTELPETQVWIELFAKEAFIGLAIGVFFGLFLWAFEAAGVVIDMQVGASFALFQDPILGNENSPLGSFLGLWASYLFLAAGGLMLFVGVLMESFAVWPLVQPIDSFNTAAVALFESEFSLFMSLVVRIAGPIIAVLFLIDISMGLINRYAQNFNVFFLSMSIKAMASVVLLLVLMPFLVDLLLDELYLHAESTQDLLNLLFLP
ncbi:MAG: type III secretion system export apparatus subunit SctT [Granulosicoccus sp.]